MITEDFIKKMEEIVGKSFVSKSGADIELYSYDASLISGKPGLIVFPASTEEVSQIHKAAYEAGIPSVCRGFATNLSGGTIIVEGLVISLARLDQILGIYPEGRYAVVQTGVTNLEIQEALAPMGLFYAPDPASQKASTIGGNVGENSGGPRCLKYGVTENHILGMRMVMADGEVVDIAGPAYDPPGYDLRGLMVGSEGCLGVITEITIRLTNMTEDIITMLGVYDSIPDAAKTVSEIIAAGIVPNTLEMMDNTVIQAVEQGVSCGYPTDAAAVLIVEVEGMTVGLKEQAETIREICMKCGCREVRVAKDNAERDLLWKGRRIAFGAICNLSPNYLVNDGCVPRSRLPEALDKIKEVSDKYGCPVGNVFHAGDGNLHPLLMFDSRNEEQLAQVHKAGHAIMEVCAELGGTISGEHGIGHEKQEGMRMVFSGHDLNTQNEIKLAIDPKNLLNPGKVIPVPEKGERKLPDFEPTVLKRPGGKNAAGVEDAIVEIKKAAREGKPVRLSGSGTFNGYGNSLSAETRVVDSLKMNEIIEYDTDNMFITVGSGMPFSELQEKLAKDNNWLPLRPPFFKENSTIGSVIAMAAVGPERVAYGAPRDMLLGLQYIDSQGSMVTAGGKVVKNVAGYDMTRLLTGSAGTIGFITEASWMVATRPEVCKLTSAKGSLENCNSTALKVINSNLLSVFTTIVPEGNQWKLMVGFEGIAQVVNHQIERCGTVMTENGLDVQETNDYSVIDGCFKDIFAAIEELPFVCQAEIIPTRVKDCYEGVADMVKPSQYMLDSGCGRIYFGFDALTGEQWKRMDNLFKECQGTGKLLKAPEDFKKNNDVYGNGRADWQLSQKIKAALDPNGLFSPGALPGKI